MMRLSATALALGWMKLTVAAAPILKLCQLRATRWLACCTVSTLAVWLMAALPATTLPPVGRALLSRACTGAPMRATETTSSLTHATTARRVWWGFRARPTVPPARLPRPMALSATATQVRVRSFQIKR